MKVGDKYVKAYYSARQMKKEQNGKKVWIIITDKTGDKPKDYRVFYRVYCDGNYQYDYSAKVFRSSFKFFDNFRRPDDYSCLFYRWCKHYDGEDYF